MAAAGVAVVLAAAGWFAYHAHHPGVPATSSTAASAASVASATVAGSTASTTSAAASSVSPSRIVRVENPHIRTIARDVEYTFDDVMNTPENAPPAPDFDTHALVITTPRRMKSELLDTVFLGELTNTSPDRVAIAPTVKLTLTRGGTTIDSAEHHFPDLAPGAHVAVFFHYEGPTRSFDRMNFVWKPTKSYLQGAPRHPRLVTTVLSQKQESSDTLHVAERFRYWFIRVHGSITNQGDREAKGVNIYVLLRDAKGQLTGYERSTVRETIAPGATVMFDSAAVIWGEPSVGVEAVALPVTPPSL
jgi:hypothetical protein